MNVLQLIIDRQHQLQVESFGIDPTALDSQQRAGFIREMSLALTDEVHEALAEVTWKTWSKGDKFNRDAYVAELIDALHFWVNLGLVAGITEREVYDAYMLKAAKNAKRQADGYDETNKCPVCKRALDDEFVTCTQTVCSETTTMMEAM